MEKNSIGFLNQIIAAQTAFIKATFDLDNFLNLIVKEIERLTKANGVVVELVDGDDMVYRAASGTVASHLGLHLNRDTSISGLCVKEKKILRSDDTETDPRVNVEACRRVHARSLIVTPLFHGKEAIGVVKILSAKPTAFNEQDVEILTMMADIIAGALSHQMDFANTHHALTEKTSALDTITLENIKLSQRADYDYLTKLANRELLTKHLSVVLANSKNSNNTHALFFLDIDHFKNVNDTYGHDVGDELLQAVAGRLLHCIRKSDVAARFGGDEFVILFEKISAKKDIKQIAKSIITKINSPFNVKGNSLNISTSIGITFFKSNQYAVEDLLKRADQALYLAKNSGRNNYKVVA